MMYEQYIILQFKAEKNEIEARAKAQERATALMSMWKDYIIIIQISQTISYLK